MSAAVRDNTAADDERLVARGLSKWFRKRAVVDDVHLDVGKGEIVGLLGPNGAGKTTSFYMIVGLVAPDAGHIALAGRNLVGLPMHRRAALGIGYLPQEASVFRKLSVADNIRAILQVRPGLGKKQIEDRVASLLAEFSITQIASAKGRTLSGGERRRVEIARALAAEPRFILLDEPFAGIDPIAIGDIRAIIGHLQQRGIGVLITDHNVRETLGICERAYILSEGRVIAEGPGETILADKQVRQVYLGEDFRL